MILTRSIFRKTVQNGLPADSEEVEELYCHYDRYLDSLRKMAAKAQGIPQLYMLLSCTYLAYTFIQSAAWNAGYCRTQKTKRFRCVKVADYVGALQIKLLSAI